MRFAFEINYEMLHLMSPVFHFFAAVKQQNNDDDASTMTALAVLLSLRAHRLNKTN